MEMWAVITYDTDDKTKARLIEADIRGSFERIARTLEDSDVDYSLLFSDEGEP